MTVDEFMALPENGTRHELVRGELREMPPAKGDHGFIEAAIAAAIDRYLHAKALALGWTPDDGIGARDAPVGRVGVGEDLLPGFDLPLGLIFARS
jgi:Uma2 family endonuclease